MVYEFRYESKSNHYNNLNLIVNTKEKTFYAWKSVLYREEKYSKVVNNENRLLTNARYKKDVADLIISFRNDKEYTEV